MPNLLRGLSRANPAGEDHSPLLARILNMPGQGGALPAEELRTLAGESNPEIFYESLLQIGQRLEAENRLEAAGQIYTAIISSPASFPVARAARPRNWGVRPASAHDAGVGVVQNRGPEGPCYEEIRQRAQARLNAMTGTGSSAHRAEFLLRRLARESMEPSTLIGLTAASAAFRMTRLSGLSRLLGSPTANFATRGFGARAAAGLLGFGVEATVFPLASRGAAAALGRNLDWSFNQVGREIAGSFIVLGAMKLVGWGLPHLGHGRLIRGGAGPTLQQAGMFAGILLGHHLETAVGLRPHVDGATTFVDSLAMLVQLNAAGRLAHGMMGEGFRTWELALDHQARTLSAPPHPPFPAIRRGERDHPLPREERALLRGGLLEFSEVLAYPSPRRGEGGRRPGEGARPRSRDRFPLHTFMTGSGEGPGGKRPQRETTLPFIAQNRDPSSKAPAAEEGRDPLVVDLFPQILRRMKSDDLNFRRTLLGENILFRFTEAFPENLDRHLKPIQEYLDSLVAETKPGQEVPEPSQKIPFARKVTILSEVTQQRIVFMKTLMGGFDRIITSNPMAEETPGENQMEKSPTSPPRGPQAGVLPRLPLEPSVAPSDPSPFLGEASLPTPLVTDLERLPLMIRTGVLGRLSGELVLIVEGTEIPPEQLRRIGDDLGPNLRPETRLRLFSAREEKTFEGRVEGNRLVWVDIQDPSWERLRRQRVFNRLVIHSPDEVYRQILIYSQDANRGADTESFMRLKGVPESWDSFLPFVTRALNLYRMAGSRLVVESESQGLTLRWEKNDQGWMLDAESLRGGAEAADVPVLKRRVVTAPLRITPPPAAPATVADIAETSPGAPSPLSEHFIRMREILRDIRGRQSRLPEEAAALPAEPTKEVLGMEGRDWLNVEDFRSLYEVLNRPAEGAGEDVQNIWLHLPDALTASNIQEIQLHLARRFPAQRTAYLYSEVSQTIHRITRHGSEIRVDELSVDED